MRLYRLSPEAHGLVTQQLVSGERQRYEPADYEPFLDECDDKLDLDRFEDVVDEIIATTTAHDATIDQLAGPAVHAALPLSRRTAAQPGIWRFLAVVVRPELVRHRWEARSWSTMRTRFWRAGTRHDSNAISRLWWIAELTRDNDDYELTRRALSRQPLAINVFVRRFSHYRPAVHAFVEVMDDASSDVIEQSVRQFNALLGTHVLERLGVDELVEWLRRIRMGLESTP